MASLGPHGVFRTILAVLAADTEGLAEPAVRKVLGTYLSGPGLVRPVEVLMEDGAPVPLSEGLADLYRASWSRLTWDPSIPAFRLTTKDVKGRTSDRR